MPEKTNTPTFEEKLKDLTAIVFSHAGDIHKEWTAGYGDNSHKQARLCECCGASAYGYRTFNSAYAPAIVPKYEKAEWNTKNIIVGGFIDAEELPELPTGRMFIRIKGDKKDFLMTWETT